MKIKYSPIAIILFILLSACGSKSTQHLNNNPKPTIGEIKTPLGVMTFELSDKTPNHKTKFIELANLNHYNQFTFNRVIKDFVIQGGCPDSVQYFENSPYLLNPEFHKDLKHTYGALGIGRDENPLKQSNVCQFYIVTNENGLPRLDDNYMIIGHITKGFDVLKQIETAKTDTNDMPIQQIPLEVTIKQ
ncbi:MAG: peptidylprolyl isomerase [Flavobacteriales bacterium]